MIINRIRFENYRVYYGEAVFDFPIEQERNISVIFANNDVGKTSFFQGVLFCLYDEKSTGNLKELINVNAQREGKYQASVSIFAEQDGSAIEITRTIELRGSVQREPRVTDFKTTLTIIRNGTPLVADLDEKTDFINSLIHQDAAQYFFFDGEKITNYSTAQGSQYKEAIARILGIKEIDNAIEDLGLIKKDFERERDAWVKQQDKYADKLEKKDQAAEEVQQHEELVRQYEQEIQAANEKIRKIEEKLKGFEQNQERIDKKHELEHEISALESEKQQAADESRECWEKNATCILGVCAYHQMTDDDEFRDERPAIDTSIREHLLYLIEQSRCVCGEEMDAVHIENIRQYIAENFITEEGLQIKNEQNKLFYAIRKYSEQGIRSKNRIEELNDKALEYESKIVELKRDLAKLKRQIGSFSEEAGERLSQDLVKLEAKRDETRERLGSEKTLLEQARERLAQCERELAGLSNATVEGQACQKKLDLTKQLMETFVAYRERLLEEKRQAVEENATSVFRAITNAPRKYKGIKIKSDYSLLLELTNGETYQIEPNRVLNPSTGQSKVISLSYISGLNQSSDFAAPVIIDNPLGLFSDEHRASIAKYLPKFGKQVIFMVSTGDLPDKYRDILSPYVKTEYYLESDTSHTWPKTRIAKREVYE